VDSRIFTYLSRRDRRLNKGHLDERSEELNNAVVIIDTKSMSAKVHQHIKITILL
jgi:hypothetical protein